VTAVVLVVNTHLSVVYLRLLQKTDKSRPSTYCIGWLGSRVVSVLDSGAEKARVQIAAATL